MQKRNSRTRGERSVADGRNWVAPVAFATCVAKLPPNISIVERARMNSVRAYHVIGYLICAYSKHM